MLQKEQVLALLGDNDTPFSKKVSHTLTFLMHEINPDFCH